MEETKAPGVSLEIKLVQIDYYRARKFQRGEPGVHGVRAKNYVNSPVVRVFGVTPGGQAMCLHVHGALPYFYVEFKDEDLRDVVGSYMRENGDVGCRTPQEQAGLYVKLFQKALNVALHEQRVAAYNDHVEEDNGTGQSGVKVDRFVCDVQLVRGTPFYGFHRQECVWMKVYMYDPVCVKKAASLLLSGAIFGKTFQPHESHIPFLLQFKIDHNLYGMGWMKLKNVTFRAPVPRISDNHTSQSDRNKEDGPMIWSMATVGCITTAARATTCELEGDVMASDILNVFDKVRVDINQAPPEFQVVDSLGPIWAEERRRQGKSDVRPTPPDIERIVEQIDPDTVELWRDKFSDAERNRLFHEESSDEDLPSTLGTCPSANDVPSSAHVAVGREDISEGFMKSLVDIELIRSSQRQRERDGETERIFSVLEEWEQTQREKGYMCSQHEDGGDDELALLARAFEDSSKDRMNTTDPMKVLEMFMNSQDMSSRALAGRKAQSVLSQGAREAENECRDIIEASQAFEDEIKTIKKKKLRIPQVDGAGDSEEEEEEADQCKDSRASEQNSKTFYMSRKDVLRTRKRLSQITDLLLGRVQAPKSHASTGIPEKDLTDAPDAVFPDDSFITQKDTIAERNSQEALNFWSEPGSQFILGHFHDDQEEGNEGNADEIYVDVKPGREPPLATEVKNTWDDYGLSSVVHPGPHFSSSADIGKRCQVFGGRTFHLKSSVTDELPVFGMSTTSRLSEKLKSFGREPEDILTIRLFKDPPTYRAVKHWVARGKPATNSPVGPQAAQANMDPNTGRFIPSGQHTSLHSDSSLIGTPMLLSHDQHPHPSAATPGSSAAEIRDSEIRPASPKYDELEAFYVETFNEDSSKVYRGMKSPVNSAMKSKRKVRQSFSQISAPSGFYSGNTPDSQLGFQRRSPNKGEGLKLLAIEVHASSRQDLLPDPEFDSVCAVALSIFTDSEAIESGQYSTWIILIETDPESVKRISNFDGMTDVQFEIVSSELELFKTLTVAIRSLDPDILVGFEVQKESIGYLADRARHAFGNNTFLSNISRVLGEKSDMLEMIEHDQYGWQHDSGLHVTGRILLNLWRIIRSEVKLGSYSFENCVSCILKLRVPCIKTGQMHRWFMSHHSRWRCFSHLVLCNRLCLRMIQQLDFVGRTAELARTFGIDFFSVISRGSQYRVESMMIRLAHSQNFIALSPNQEQVARQPAMEALPLVMEPLSGMYEDPVCVLDFQSLYPSIIIAYNLCFSTCIGRPNHLFPQESEQQRLGCREHFKLDSSLHQIGLEAKDLIVTPNGVGFVPASCRMGILPRLLQEILETRIMVKSAMRNSPPNAKALLRSLNAKQFALKLIANVTYGYTSAGFSGRMPMAELADAIVQSGRETLESTIRYIRDHPKWKADVIYGDTDSIFVRLPGRTVSEAHAIGQDIAKVITSRNPKPMLLKLEKVYRPCFLLSKKRYVGAMYESPHQMKFQFDAKGIETVRRDSCPAVVKIVEQSLRILFTSADVSLVKKYVERQWKRIISGRVSIKDFIFAKEVRLGTYSGSASSIPPAALVATKAMSKDPRAEPRFGERVSYVVVHGEPGARLIDMVVPPETLVESQGQLRLHAVYYITKQIIPALERFMRLIGVDVKSWYSHMPKVYRHLPHKRPLSTLPIIEGQSTVPRANTIDKFYLSRHCVCCDNLTMVNKPLCSACENNPQLVAIALPLRLNKIERQSIQIGRICTTCGGASDPCEGIVCKSLDCGLYFERRKVHFELQTAKALAEMIS